MPHKKPRNQSVDKSPTPPVRTAYPGRPSQDARAAQQAAQFPSVGITLGSYKHDPFKAAQGRNRPLPKPKKEPGRFRRTFTVKRVSLCVVLLMAAVGLWLGGKFVYNAHKLFHGNFLSVLTTTKLKGEDQGRINILLAGNSSDDVGHNGGNLTDSIMILSIDTKNNQAFMLSVPRDLYVEIPDTSSHSKINYAYVAGENSKFSENGYAPGGMGELEKVISDNFGITINYYALVNYTALRDAVDAVGGVDITISSTDPRGLYDPNIDYATHKPLVKLTNGVHHLDGEAALDLARARGDSYYSYGFAASDFERTKNQRNILIALKTKAVTAGVLSNPAKLSSLSDAIGGNVKTDFSLSEVHRLYDLIKNIPSGSIKSYSLNSVNGKNLLASYTTSDGQSALTPAAGLDDFEDIQQFMKQITSNDPIIQEGASLVILNGTGTAGLAGQQRLRLEAKNYNVDDVGNAATQPTTTIIQTKAGNDPHTLAALQKLYGKTATTTNTNPYATNYPSADFIIILGTDQVPTTATTSTSTTQ